MRRNLVVEKPQNGWLFADEKGHRRKMGHYDPLLVELLEKVKHHFPGVVPAAVEPSDLVCGDQGGEAGPLPPSVWECLNRLLI